MDQFRPREDNNPVEDLKRGFDDVKRRLDKLGGGKILVLALVVALLAYLGSGVYVIGAGEKGVVLLFGKVYGVTEPGLRYRLPRPFMMHMLVDVQRVRRTELGFRSDGDRSRSVPMESLMLTGDENIVDVQLFVQYIVQDPIKFLFGAVQPEVALRTSGEVALRGVVGENTIDFTMTKGRAEVQQKVQLYLQRLLDAYETGLVITESRLLVVDPPSQVQEAFHDVVRAWEDRERLIREAEGYREDVLPKARGEAFQEIQRAEGYKAQRVIRAKGDGERFSKVLFEYHKAPRVTRERLYLEAVERFLPTTRKFIMEGGNSRVLPLLPLTGADETTVKPNPGNDKNDPATPKKGN
ncbi:MAG: FtsH protease activity modulator HflK [Pseudomonadota bacterium]